MSKKIVVRDVIGDKNAVSCEDAEKVYNLIVKRLVKFKKVEVSFEDISILTGAFIQDSIGNLYGVFREDLINRYFEIVDVTIDHRDYINLTIDDSKQYFEDPEGYDEAYQYVMDNY